MKQLLCWTILAALALPGMVLAQPEESPNQSDHNDFPELEISMVDIPDGNSFEAGETIEGSVQITNPHDTHFPDLQLWVALDLFPNDQLKGLNLGNRRQDTVFIPKNGTIKVPFSYTVPSTAGSGRAELYISLLYPRHGFAADATRQLRITGPGTMLSFVDQGAMTRDQWIEVTSDARGYTDRYVVGDTPSIFESRQEEAEIQFRAENPSNTSLSVTPTITVYRNAEHPNRGGTSVESSTITLAPGERRLVSIPLPVFEYAPGLYRGYLTGSDASGVQRLPEAEFSYIIQGDTATVRAVTTNREWLGNGQTANLSLYYSGVLEDIGRPGFGVRVNDAGERQGRAGSGNISDLSATIELYNHAKERVGAVELTDLQAGPGIHHREARVRSDAPSESLSAKITLTADGEVVDTYITKLSSQSYKLPLIAYINRTLAAVVLLVVLAGVLATLFIRKHRARIGVTLLVVGLLSGAAFLTSATVFSAELELAYYSQLSDPVNADLAPRNATMEQWPCYDILQEWDDNVTAHKSCFDLHLTFDAPKPLGAKQTVKFPLPSHFYFTLDRGNSVDSFLGGDWPWHINTYSVDWEQFCTATNSTRKTSFSCRLSNLTTAHNYLRSWTGDIYVENVVEPNPTVRILRSTGRRFAANPRFAGFKREFNGEHGKYQTREQKENYQLQEIDGLEDQYSEQSNDFDWNDSLTLYLDNDNVWDDPEESIEYCDPNRVWWTGDQTTTYTGCQRETEISENGDYSILVDTFGGRFGDENNESHRYNDRACSVSYDAVEGIWMGSCNYDTSDGTKTMTKIDPSGVGDDIDNEAYEWWLSTPSRKKCDLNGWDCTINDSISQDYFEAQYYDGYKEDQYYVSSTDYLEAAWYTDEFTVQEAYDLTADHLSRRIDNDAAHGNGTFRTTEYDFPTAWHYGVFPSAACLAGPVGGNGCYGDSAVATAAEVVEFEIEIGTGRLGQESGDRRDNELLKNSQYEVTYTIEQNSGDGWFVVDTRTVGGTSNSQGELVIKDQWLHPHDYASASDLSDPDVERHEWRVGEDIPNPVLVESVAGSTPTGRMYASWTFTQDNILDFSLIAEPDQILGGETSTIQWNIAGSHPTDRPHWCTKLQGDDSWTGPAETNPDDGTYSHQTGPLLSTTTFTLECIHPTWVLQKSVVVEVLEREDPSCAITSPSANADGEHIIEPGESATWSVTNTGDYNEFEWSGHAEIAGQTGTSATAMYEEAGTYSGFVVGSWTSDSGTVVSSGKIYCGDTDPNDSPNDGGDDRGDGSGDGDGGGDDDGDPHCRDLCVENDLKAPSCTLNGDSVIETGQSASWSVTDTGDYDNFTWQGHSEVSGQTGTSANATYSNEGEFIGTIHATTNSGDSANAYCGILTVDDEPDPCQLSCSASPSSIRTGESASWSASDAGGGCNNFEWGGHEEISGEGGSSVEATYNVEGTYSGTVYAKDKYGKQFSASCSLDVTDDDILSCTVSPSSLTIGSGETADAVWSISEGSESFGSFTWSGTGGAVIGAGGTVTYDESNWGDEFVGTVTGYKANGTTVNAQCELPLKITPDIAPATCSVVCEDDCVDGATATWTASVSSDYSSWEWTGWLSGKTGTPVTLTNLAADEYSVGVQATTADGYESTGECSLSVTGDTTIPLSCSGDVDPDDNGSEYLVEWSAGGGSGSGYSWTFDPDPDSSNGSTGNTVLYNYGSNDGTKQATVTDSDGTEKDCNVTLPGGGGGGSGDLSCVLVTTEPIFVNSPVTWEAKYTGGAFREFRWAGEELDGEVSPASALGPEEPVEIEVRYSTIGKKTAEVTAVDDSGNDIGVAVQCLTTTGEDTLNVQVDPRYEEF
ncbi:MAG: hypothetical protein WDZ79_01620 [Candidatus Paceibacterota bacterium]